MTLFIIPILSKSLSPYLVNKYFLKDKISVDDSFVAEG